jgi:hypothetical protein
LEKINQNLYHLRRVFVQGDRDPEGAAREAATKLGLGLKENCWGVTLGAYGGFVKVLEETGVSCVCHETKIRDHGETKATHFPTIKCQELGETVAIMLGSGVFAQAVDEINWSIRLGVWMGTSQAYCFFAGREGTLGHLAPVMTYNAKGWAKRGRARKVCLLGWDIEDVAAIMRLYKIQRNTTWFGYFSLEEVDKAVEFLTT